MKLQGNGKERTTKMSLVELAKQVLIEEKIEMSFLDLFEKVAVLKGLSEEEKNERIAQFYTDLNMDGNFVSTGSNVWGLKRWTLSKTSQEKSEGTEKFIRKRRTRVKRRDESKDDIDEELLLVDDNFVFDDDIDLEDGYDENFASIGEIDLDEDDQDDYSEESYNA